MLAMEVVFLTGRYVATAYNTRAESEWPPHPARLFSALVATHFSLPEDDERRATERVVLEWLEAQSPPSIGASDAFMRDTVTVFVPVNDVALTDVDAEALALEEARAAVAGGSDADPRSRRKLDVALKKAETTFQKALSRATLATTAPTNASLGQRVLPEHRLRQPRTFPSMTPLDPRVTYVWDHARPDVELRAALSGLLRRVVRLGHSSSLVAIRIVDEPGPSTWRPDAGGEHTLRVIQRGQLAALERAYRQHRETEPRVLPATPQSYTRGAAVQRDEVPGSLFSDDWLVLRRVGGPEVPMIAAAGVARALRRALMSYSLEPIPELLSGHAANGTPTSRAHLGVVPLPFIGHAHASGAILGIALVLPRDVSDGERRGVYAAVAAWESRERREDEDVPRLCVTLGAAGMLELERVDWGTVQASVRAETWCRPSVAWSSATPIALDRNPGDLQSRNPRKLASAVQEARTSIADSCERIGLPRPIDVEVLPAPPWAAAAKATHYPAFPPVEQRTQRVLTHARVVFGRDVRGPILLGAGRFVGLGLLRPESPR